jgi:hypothetical protein
MQIANGLSVECLYEFRAKPITALGSEDMECQQGWHIAFLNWRSLHRRTTEFSKPPGS